MKTKWYLSTFIPTLLLFVVVIPSAVAHVPDFGGGGDSLDTATHIHDPLKSWVIYDELHESGEAHYFSTHLDEGQRLRLQFFSPDQNFAPSVAIMGPGIEANDTLPSFVEIPSGSGALLIEGERQEEAEYEPFTPASYYYFGDLDWQVTAHGDYFIAVFHTDQEGKYGMAIGYVEEFTLEEWLSVPIDAVRIHEWGGQNVVLILAPLIGTLLVGSVLLIWPPGRGRLSQESEIWRFLVSFAGLLFIGGGLMLATQMAIATSKSGFDVLSILTLVFIFVPLVLGYLLVRKAINKDSSLTPRNRVILLILGLLGLFVWAGMIIGPILSMIATLLPSGLAFQGGSMDKTQENIE